LAKSSHYKKQPKILKNAGISSRNINRKNLNKSQMTNEERLSKWLDYLGQFMDNALSGTPSSISQPENFTSGVQYDNLPFGCTLSQTKKMKILIKAIIELCQQNNSRQQAYFSSLFYDAPNNQNLITRTQSLENVSKRILSHTIYGNFLFDVLLTALQKIDSFKETQLRFLLYNTTPQLTIKLDRKNNTRHEECAVLFENLLKKKWVQKIYERILTSQKPDLIFNFKEEYVKDVLDKCYFSELGTGLSGITIISGQIFINRSYLKDIEAGVSMIVSTMMHELLHFLRRTLINKCHYEESPTQDLKKEFRLRGKFVCAGEIADQLLYGKHDFPVIYEKEADVFQKLQNWNTEKKFHDEFQKISKLRKKYRGSCHPFRNNNEIPKCAFSLIRGNSQL